ncbi:MAG: HAMP domain-containing protein [Magnetococcales bacterium]|nr:HAMP domain-containing protein [Magnetococcales bacterium]MBF0114262.1 HAMP domain-containing protein [Magnetococcales bacterium]
MASFPVRFSIQFKLFLYFLAIITLALAIGGAISEELLVNNRTASIRQELLRHLRTIELLLNTRSSPLPEEEYTRLAHHLGSTLEMRVTLINQQGQVLGDSAVDSQQLLLVENHLTRPEVVAALQQKTGSTIRHSSTVNQDLFYMAYKVRHANQEMVVRLARPMQDLHDEILQLRQLVLVSLLLAMVLAILMSGLASFLATRSLRGLLTQAEQLVDHGANTPLVVTSRDEIGGLAASFNVMVDRLEEALAELALERDRLKTVLEGIVDAVIAVDAAGQITLVNPAAMTLLQLQESPVAKPLASVLPTDQWPDALPPCQTVTWYGELTLASEQKRVQISCACTQSNQGAILLLRDVTEKYRLQQLQRDFVANASHELRTPVSIIRLNAETLMDGIIDASDPSHFLVEALFRQSLRLSQLVSDLLDISRLESGSYSFHPKPVLVHPLIEETVNALQQWTGDKKILFSNLVERSLQVIVDPSAFEQILTNLIGNAFAYVPDGGKVTLSLGTATAGWLCLQVEDDGPGIPTALHAVVFNRFYRVDPGRSRSMGGTGLGLTIVKYLVEGMGGQIGLHTVEPHGCRFWFTLPSTET